MYLIISDIIEQHSYSSVKVCALYDGSGAPPPVVDYVTVPSMVFLVGTSRLCDAQAGGAMAAERDGYTFSTLRQLGTHVRLTHVIYQYE